MQVALSSEFVLSQKVNIHFQNYLPLYTNPEKCKIVTSPLKKNVKYGNNYYFLDLKFKNTLC